MVAVSGRVGDAEHGADVESGDVGEAEFWGDRLGTVEGDEKAVSVPDTPEGDGDFNEVDGSFECVDSIVLDVSTVIVAEAVLALVAGVEDTWEEGVAKLVALDESEKVCVHPTMRCEILVAHG